MPGTPRSSTSPRWLELELGADNEILHRARHQHLAGGGLALDPGADVDPDAGEVPSVISTSPVWIPTRTSMPEAARSPPRRPVLPGRRGRARRTGPGCRPRRSATSWPPNRAVSCRTSGRCRSSSSRHRRSPRLDASPVEPTMSVNTTVASTRSAPGPTADPGEELLDLVDDLVRVDPGEVVVAVQFDEPALRGSERRCTGPPRRLASVSPIRCSTSVGTWIAGSTGRTSMWRS